MSFWTDGQKCLLRFVALITHQKTLGIIEQEIVVICHEFLNFPIFFQLIWVLPRWIHNRRGPRRAVHRESDALP